MGNNPIPETIPDHVSLDPESPHFFKWYKKIGVKVDGMVIFNCLEFCVSEGWAALGVKDFRGYFKRERGKLIAVRKQCLVEPYWR